MTDRFDVVAAFVDGEPVRAEDLRAALAHDDARTYLVDVLALRGLVNGVRPQLTAVGKPPRAGASRARWFAVAAALVVAGIAGGFAAGRGTIAGDSPQSSVVSAPAAAPAPTHVFRMENGVNWNEKAGGN